MTDKMIVERIKIKTVKRMQSSRNRKQHPAMVKKRIIKIRRNAEVVEFDAVLEFVELEVGKQV